MAQRVEGPPVAQLNAGSPVQVEEVLARQFARQALAVLDETSEQEAFADLAYGPLGAHWYVSEQICERLTVSQGLCHEKVQETVAACHIIFPVVFVVYPGEPERCHSGGGVLEVGRLSPFPRGRRRAPMEL